MYNSFAKIAMLFLQMHNYVYIFEAGIGWRLLGKGIEMNISSVNIAFLLMEAVFLIFSQLYRAFNDNFIVKCTNIFLQNVLTVDDVFGKL
ncbi:hypothetical protein [Paenibacillus sp. MMS20-IR301]|uniref:hypothetical protein n=1 Tax=Paenibacillus sp. MMS20-IR301 TaxID=2895946 RepID=UPI0028ED0A66|nr:hypothetical protein [Paenibacillus sp. MMS20-IR301]WNS43968.1 hypothetical protein LOS79_01500 [Paenibacillus sp. MMS20-IR301]